jgi:EAL domain-containing protein (putative c-di-GMP-specific phosphodiesterase class I)
MNRTQFFETLLERRTPPDIGTEMHLFSHRLDRLLSGDLVPEIYFQPIIDLRRGAVTGYEALARFPEEMQLAPEACFQRATQLGRRIELEHMVCGIVLSKRADLPRGCFLTMNLGPDYLLSDLWQELLTTQADLSGVVIEITEETSISSYDEIRERSAQIRTMGGLVAVDDAGAGYASLQHILELRPDFIKLNRHFVRNCHQDRAKSTMIEMMGAAADRLDAWIIAEGVETVPELEELIRIGVPLAQGYLLARPNMRMQGVNAQVAEDLTRRAEIYRDQTVEPHLSPSAMCSSVRAGEELLKGNEVYTAAVVVDRWKHPLSVVQNHPQAGVRILESFTKTQVSSSPHQVLFRALARERAVRLDPVVVINNEGECVGVVEIDHLMSMVLSFDSRGV